MYVYYREDGDEKRKWQDLVRTKGARVPEWVINKMERLEASVV